MKAPLVRWALAICALLLGARIALVGVADSVAFTYPDFALMLDGGNVRALTVRASTRLSGVEGAAEAAAADARAALRADVFASGAYRTLARAAEAAGDEAGAGALWRIAARSARDGEAQSAMILRAISGGDSREAIQRFDVLLRGQHPWLWRAITSAAAPLFTDPAIAGSLVDMMATDPPWRRPAVIELFEKAPDTALVMSIHEGLDRSASRPSDDEARAYLQRLVRDGRLTEAYVAFVRRLPDDRLARMGYLYNARFQFGLSNLPFDWEILQTPGALTDVVEEPGRRVLKVSFFGARIHFRNVSHLLALPPGAYTYTGLERAESLQNPRGIRWSVRCAGQGGVDGPELGVTNLLRGDVPWRPFALAFTVPEGCPVQRLVMELPARVALEQEASGAVAFTDLAIQ
ncbi:MAG: hypothetical protein K2Y29_00155 [Beijerinckiaceae bacterium]|nr:hypothetical protein [Beijerinckiaceae bacterium]